MELNLEAVSNRKFDFDLHDEERVISVEVTLPDIKNLEYSVGERQLPAYCFKLKKGCNLGIRYDDTIDYSDQDVLQIESPLLPVEREIYPYFFIVDDKKKMLSYHLYLDRAHHLGKVDVIRKQDMTTLNEHGEREYLQ